MTINNTHYNLIDTLVHLIGQEKFSEMYKDFRDNFLIPYIDRHYNFYIPDLNNAYHDAKNIPLPIASVYVDCFIFIWECKNRFGDEYGIK